MATQKIQSLTYAFDELELTCDLLLRLPLPLFCDWLMDP